MKKQFTPNEIRSNRGCYSLEEVNKLSFINKDSIDIIDILNSEIQIKDRLWFLRNKCNLNLAEKIKISYICAKTVSPIFKSKYPNDNRIELCLNGILDYKNNKIGRKELVSLKENADAAYADAADAAAAASAAADAADAAAAASAASAAAAAAYADADAAADAYAADAKLSYKTILIDNIIQLINTLN
jgi:hypothetical protein